MHDLQERNCRGKDFTKCDFTGADIRGIDFTDAKLVKANFSQSKSGLRTISAVGLLMALFPLLIVSGTLSVSISSSIIFAQSTELHEIASLSTSLCILFALIVAFSFREVLVFAVAFIAVASLVCTGAVLFKLTGERFADYTFFSIYEGAYIGVFQGSVEFIGVLLVATIFACAKATAGFIGLCCTIVIALTFSFTGIASELDVIRVILIGILTSWSVYVGTEALRERGKYRWMRDIAIFYSSTGGTSFRNADLTDANFSGADLKGADLRSATLTRTYWKDAKQLDRARLGNSYLSNLKVRELLRTTNGESQSFGDIRVLDELNLNDAKLAKAIFTGCSLKDSTLKNADLTDAKLAEANLNGAHLCGACLLGAELAQSQLDGANLNGTALTGAYIGFWNVTARTQISDVECDYVFLNVSKNDAESSGYKRKPDSWETCFSRGEFSDFVKPLVTTLDFYYNRDFNFTAFALAFCNICQRYPDADIDISSIEKKGEDKNSILIRASVRSDEDISQISKLQEAEYEKINSLSSETLSSLYVDNAKLLQELITQLLSVNSQSTHSVIIQNFTGNTFMTENKHGPSINVHNEQLAGGMIIGDGGTSSGGTNIIHKESPMSLPDAAKEIQDLLQQLSYSNPEATEVEKIDYIRTNFPPTRRERLVSAVQSAGKAALDEIPYGRIIKATVEGWSSPQSQS